MRIMEQLRLTALGELLLEPQPDRSPGPGEVVVEVVVAGISGSGVHGYRGVNGRRDLLRALGLPTLPFGAEPRRTPDAVLDCVAVDDSLAYALQHVAPGGDVVVVGLGAALAALPVERLVQGALGLLGSAQYTPATFADAAAWAASGRLDLEPLLGLPRPLSEGPALFAQWDDDPDRPLRTLLTPG